MTNSLNPSQQIVIQTYSEGKYAHMAHTSGEVLDSHLDSIIDPFLVVMLFLLDDEAQCNTLLEGHKRLSYMADELDACMAVLEEIIDAVELHNEPAANTIPV
jgi:hypothetical protein